ncbi:MAG: hypothetical protein KAG56_00105 [Sulfurovaceae bacterium]|nr:hypothetical protein [Sulfurovaceae bacterium]
MGNKRKTVTLSEQNITFTEKEELYTVLNFNPNSMKVEVSIIGKSEKKRVQKMAFAHLPKYIKQVIRPI